MNPSSLPLPIIAIPVPGVASDAPVERIASKTTLTWRQVGRLRTWCKLPVRVADIPDIVVAPSGNSASLNNNVIWVDLKHPETHALMRTINGPAAFDLRDKHLVNAELLEQLRRIARLHPIYLNFDSYGYLTPEHVNTLASFPRLFGLSAFVSTIGVADLGNLRTLNELELFARLPESGTEALTRLTELRELRIESHRVPPSPLSHVASLRKLRKVTLLMPLAAVDLKVLRSLPELTALSLKDARIDDAGIAPIRGLKNLRHLDVTRTSITDAAIGHIGTLRHLQTIRLNGTKVTDAGYSQLANSQNLRHLVTNANITAAGLAHLRGLTHLRILDLRGSNVSGGLHHIAKFTQLQNLTLHHANLMDAELAHLHGLIQLRILQLSHNKLSDAGLTHLSHLTNLRSLDLRENVGITDASVAWLQTLTSLRWLGVDGTSITPQAKKKLRESLPNASLP